MRQQEHYHHWLQSRRHVDISPDFAGRVMSQVRQQRGRRSVFDGSRLIRRIGASYWGQVAAVGVAAIIGVGRLLLTLHVLLSV
ncbi:MAG: hypothetical protein ACYTAS_06980 [Planctomycetota bacterium]|jgi:hypothetical protein